jgi:hypothetical protein
VNVADLLLYIVIGVGSACIGIVVGMDIERQKFHEHPLSRRFIVKGDCIIE